MYGCIDIEAVKNKNEKTKILAKIRMWSNGMLL